jgi:Tol biopolymer transport system component
VVRSGLIVVAAVGVLLAGCSSGAATGAVGVARHGASAPRVGQAVLTGSDVRDVSAGRVKALPRSEVLVWRQSGIWAVNAWTSKARRIARPPADVGWTYQNPDLSADRRRIAVNRDSGVAILSAATGQQVELVNPTRGYEPVWSPNGRLVTYGIGFARYRTEVFNTVTHHVFVLTNGTPAGWTSNGRSVLVLRVDGDKQALWAAPVDGRRPRRLISPMRDPNAAEYSPNGNWLVLGLSKRLPVQHGDVDFRCVLAIEKVTTGVIRELTAEHRDRCDDNPAWSPSGHEIVFERDIAHPRTGRTSARIYWMAVRHGRRSPGHPLHDLGHGMNPTW